MVAAREQHTQNEPIKLLMEIGAIYLASRKGISCIIQPGGSINDLDVIKAADRLNISMIFTKRRLFSH